MSTFFPYNVIGRKLCILTSAGKNSGKTITTINQKMVSIMDDLNLVELNKLELINLNGGVGRLERLRRLGQSTWNLITATDAYLSFKEGWDSVECK